MRKLLSVLLVGVISLHTAIAIDDPPSSGGGAGSRQSARRRTHSVPNRRASKWPLGEYRRKSEGNNKHNTFDKRDLEKFFGMKFAGSPPGSVTASSGTALRDSVTDNTSSKRRSSVTAEQDVNCSKALLYSEIIAKALGIDKDEYKTLKNDARIAESIRMINAIEVVRSTVEQFMIFGKPAVEGEGSASSSQEYGVSDGDVVAAERRAAVAEHKLIADFTVKAKADRPARTSRDGSSGNELIAARPPRRNSVLLLLIHIFNTAKARTEDIYSYFSTNITLRQAEAKQVMRLVLRAEVATATAFRIIQCGDERKLALSEKARDCAIQSLEDVGLLIEGGGKKVYCPLEPGRKVELSFGAKCAPGERSWLVAPSVAESIVM